MQATSGVGCLPNHDHGVGVVRFLHCYCNRAPLGLSSVTVTCDSPSAFGCSPPSLCLVLDAFAACSAATLPASPVRVVLRRLSTFAGFPPPQNLCRCPLGRDLPAAATPPWRQRRIMPTPSDPSSSWRRDPMMPTSSSNCAVRAFAHSQTCNASALRHLRASTPHFGGGL